MILIRLFRKEWQILIGFGLVLWLNSVLMLNWIVWNRTVYMYKKWLMCHKTTPNRLTISLYHNSSIWQGTRNALRWVRNSADFMSVGYLTLETLSFSAWVKEFFMHTFLHIRYRLPRVLNSEELLHYRLCSSWQIPLKSAQPTRIYIYIYIYIWLKFETMSVKFLRCSQQRRQANITILSSFT